VVSEELHERIRELVKSIPPGRVASYGDIAAMASAPTPRLVGRILSEDGHDLPWHRVLRSNGTPAQGLARRQLELLRAEGVLADGEKVSMKKYRWQPVRE
jgi:methylated-DNA-protein-cysteine methyltransferase related protein